MVINQILFFFVLVQLDDCVLCRIYKKREKKSTNASTNVRNRQSNEENPLLTIDDDDEDYINDHDYDPNHLSAIEASFAGEIYGMVTNSLENSFPILDELSQQQTGTSIFPDANNFFMFQDSQIPGLEETFGTPAPMDSANPEDWSSEQTGFQDEFLNPTYSSPFNIPDHFFNLYSIMPTNLPMNPSPLVNICPMNSTAPIRSLPPMNTAPSTGDLPPINTDPLAAPFPPANSQPTSEIMNAAPNHPGQPPQHR